MTDAAARPLTRLEMLRMATAQYEETLVAVHAALDDTLGRDHRTRDDSAAASIRRLAVEAEKRGAVRALLAEAERAMAAAAQFRDDDPDEQRKGRDLLRRAARAIRARADQIESGQATL